MNDLSKYLDPFQLIGFAISLFVSVGLIVIGQDTLFSFLIGLTLAVLTQLFDLQARLIKNQERSEDFTEEIIRSLNGVSIKEFSDSQEILEYVIKRVSEAKKSIDDVTIGISHPERPPSTKERYDRYTKTVFEACERSIAYREVMSFPFYLDRAEFMIQGNLPNYRLRYYEFDQTDLPPYLRYILIDSEEIIFALYREPYLPADRQVRIAVKHPDIARLFQDYFDTMWHGAKVLESENKSPLDFIQKLRSRLRPE